MDRLTAPGESITTKDLMKLGMDDVAYVKSIMIEGRPLYAIHAADGTPLTVVANRELAMATVRQHEMDAQSVH